MTISQKINQRNTGDSSQETSNRGSKKKKKQKPITAVYNYSTLTLTDSMQKGINRGLNFCVTPINLNITEMLVNFRKFERKLKWKEFFSDQDQEEVVEDWTPDIFPVE